jgi:hypothetical protein
MFAETKGSRMTRVYRGPVSVARLWEGCVRHTLALALSNVSRNSGPNDLVDWEADGRRYVMNYWTHGDADGGVLYFDEAEVVGAFFAHESDRSPFAPHHPPFDWRALYMGIPAYLWSLVERELVPVMTLDEEMPQPGITAGLWSEGGELRTAEPWSDFMRHGGELLEDELLEHEAALRRFCKHYSRLSEAQLTVLRQWLARRVRTPRHEPVLVPPEEWQLALVIDPQADPPWQPYDDLPEDGIAALRQQLASIGIIAP